MTTLRWHYGAIPWRYSVLAPALFGLLGWQQAQRLDTLPSATVWDALAAAFMGPPAGATNVLVWGNWLVFYLVFLYLMGDIARTDLFDRGFYVLPRIGSRRHWWAGKLASLIPAVGLYTALAFGAILVGAAFSLPAELAIHPDVFATSDSLRPWQFVGVLYLLVGSTLLNMAIWQWGLALIWREASWALGGTLGLMVLSFLIGSQQPTLAKWLPGTQAILRWHIAPEPGQPYFSLVWSLAYNTVLAGMLAASGGWYVAQLNIFGHRGNR